MRRIIINIIIIIIIILFSVTTSIAQMQSCQKGADLNNLPGKYIDAAHCEWPAQKASWLNGLKTAANKTIANKTLTAIETLEKESRKNYNLRGGVLKSSFSTPSNADIYYGKDHWLSYNLNIGFHEFFCVNNNAHVSEEYSIVFRAYVNKFSCIENAFQFADDNPYYETYKKYNGRFIALHDFLKLSNVTINNGKGYYQDIPESTTKPDNRSIFMTRHWYFTKNEIPIFIPVTRKEYLDALLVYYEREKLAIADKIKEIEKECAGMMKNPTAYPQLYENGKRSLVVKKAYYPDWEQRAETKKAIVQKALKENSAEWLAMPAVVKPKKENFAWKNYYGSDANDFVQIDGYYADSKEDAQKTGAFTFSGFWDDKGGTTLYKYNPAYFKGSDQSPAKPYMIELTYRYINTKLGKNLVENFTENFDFDAVRKLLEP